MKCQIVK